MEALKRLEQAIRALELILIGLFVYARLQNARGDPGGALRLLGLIRQHSSTEHRTQSQIEAELARMNLETAEIEAGLAAGATQTWLE